MASGGWYGLLDIIKQSRDPSFRGDDIERGVCANDGEPFRVGLNGQWYCPFDGARPEEQQVGPGRFSTG